MDATQFSTSKQANRLTSQLLRVVIIIWLAVLLRWLLVKLHEPGFYLAELGGWASAYYLLPALILLTLALILIPPLILGRAGSAVSRAGFFLLPVVGVNAILRLLDLARMNAICKASVEAGGESFYRYETVCDGLYLQALCGVPFLFVAGIILLAWPRRT